MKKHAIATAVGLVLIVLLSSDLLAQPGRRRAGSRPGVKASPKVSGKPSAAKPSTSPAGLPGKGGKAGLKPSGSGAGKSGLKSKTGKSPGLKPATSQTSASKSPRGKPTSGTSLLRHLHRHHHSQHHHGHWRHRNYRPWVHVNWRGLRAWLRYPVRPVLYTYNVSGGYVHNDGTRIATVTQYAEQAEKIAESAEEQQEDAQWMPMGVFGVVQKKGDDIEVTVQLAMAKDGTIGGTYRNTAANVTLPVSGAVDEKTQRAAWKIGDQDTVVMETGLENLTKDKSTVLLHFDNGVTETWTLIRLDESAAKQAVAKLDDRSIM